MLLMSGADSLNECPGRVFASWHEVLRPAGVRPEDPVGVPLGTVSQPLICHWHCLVRFRLVLLSLGTVTSTDYCLGGWRQRANGVMWGFGGNRHPLTVAERGPTSGASSRLRMIHAALSAGSKGDLVPAYGKDLHALRNERLHVSQETTSERGPAL